MDLTGVWRWLMRWLERIAHGVTRCDGGTRPEFGF